MEENLTLIEVFVNKVVDAGSGIGMSQFESLFTTILIIRFIIVAFRYNMRTSFLIICISAAATYLWYRHIIDLGLFYEFLLVRLKFTFKFGTEIQHLRLETINESKVLSWINPIGLLAYTLNSASDGGKFLIDPISMIFSVMPDGCKSMTDKLYYFIYRDIMPNLIYCGKELYGMLGHTMIYSYVTRVNKKWCPYFVRWHWTMLMSYEVCEQPVINFITRSTLYLQGVLLPIIDPWDIDEPDLLSDISIFEYQYEFLLILNIIIMLIHLSVYFYALFHAICGQYFYVPLLTTNTDLHCGFKPDTKYSGGNAKWQRLDWENAPTWVDDLKSILNFLKNILYKILGFFSKPFTILIKFINQWIEK